MRVISGSARGTKLISLEGNDTRPTLDRVKEAVFSMIAFDIPSSYVLDLFAGSGALGIEALSRGAAECDFVDLSPKALDVVKKNLEKTHLSGNTYSSDFKSFLNKTDKKYDLIFLDPPYSANYYTDAFDLIEKRNLLADDGIVIAECGTEFDFDCRNFKIIKNKRYGTVAVYVLKAGN